MIEASSTQGYSFGEITVGVKADGPISNIEEFCDVLAGRITGVSEIEGFKSLQGATAPEGKGTHQTMSNVFRMGDISFELEVGFALTTEVSLRTLNDIAREIMDLAWDTFGSYLGSKKRLGMQPYRAVVASIDAALGSQGRQVQDGHPASRTIPGAPRRQARDKVGARR